MARKRMKKKSKLDAMIERYGPAAFITWFGIFFSSIGLFWLLLEVGTDVNAIIETVVGWWGGDPSEWTGRSASAGQLAVAYLATQLVKPIRIALFVALTPVVGRLMGRKVAEPGQTPAPADGSADGESDPEA